MSIDCRQQYLRCAHSSSAFPDRLTPLPITQSIAWLESCKSKHHALRDFSPFGHAGLVQVWMQPPWKEKELYATMSNGSVVSTSLSPLVREHHAIGLRGWDEKQGLAFAVLDGSCLLLHLAIFQPTLLLLLLGLRGFAIHVCWITLLASEYHVCMSTTCHASSFSG